MSGARDEHLRRELERALGDRVVRMDRRPSAYATSFALEELDVELAGGERLELMFKDLGAPHDAARAVKPAFLVDPLREIDVYTRLLPAAGIGTARCHATAVDPAADRYWLFIERVRGVELYQVGPRSTWEHVARWLAGAHAALAPRAGSTAHLLRYDADHLMRWPRRAAAYTPVAARGLLERVAARYDEVIAKIVSLPTTVIHGELYASNVIVDAADAPSRVCAVDWEMAGAGPGLIDLAALVSGGWSPADRDAIVAAYREAVATPLRPPDADFNAALDACRLHLAIQWLGWSPNWTPPEEHATDWLQEVCVLSDSLGL